MMRRWLGVNPARLAALCVVLGSLGLAGCGAFLSAHYLIQRAQREMHAGEWQRAAFDLRTALHKDAHNAHAWILLTRLSLDAGDRNGAASALAHARLAGAKGTQVDVLQARVWLATNKASVLLSALARHTISLPPPEASLLRSRALLASGHPARAMAAIRPLLAQGSAVTRAQVLLAECLAHQGKFPQALASLSAAEQRDPKSPEPPLLKGMIEVGLGQFSAGQRSLTQALNLMAPSEPLPHRLTALVALTESRLALGRIAAAAKSQGALARLAPQAPETLLLDARLKLARGDVTDGTSELERLVAEAPGFLQARVVLGAAFLQRGDLGQAQQQLQQVVTATPGNLEADQLLADVDLKLNQPGAALSVLAPTLAAPSLDPQVLALFGEAIRRSSNSREITEPLDRELLEHPHDAAMVDNLASVYLSAGHAAQALSLLQKSGIEGDLRGDQLLIAALLDVRGAAAAGRKVDALLAANPHDPQVLALAAEYSASQHHLGRSRVLLRQALAINPNDLGLIIALAHVDEAGGHPNAARQRLSRELSAHPDALVLRLALADVLLQSHSLAQAGQVLRAAPGGAALPAVQFGLARVALVEGNLSRANIALNRAIAAGHGSAALVANAGVMLMQAKHYADALRRFTQASAAQPDNALYLLQCARAQIALNQLAAARATLAKAVHLQPKWLPAVSLLVLVDLRQGKGQGALTRVQALLASEPTNPAAIALKGDVELALHRSAAALTAYEDAWRLQPSAALAIKLYQARSAAHAPHPAQPLRAWLKRTPGDWRVRGVLASYYLQVAHATHAAEAELRAVLQRQPNDVVALNDLAWILASKGDPQAQSLAERAYHLAPNLAAVNDTLGWILARKGQGTQALPYLARATKLSPDDPELAFHYAYALAKTGRQAEARQILSAILAHPQPFQGRRQAQRLLASLKGMNRA